MKTIAIIPHETEATVVLVIKYNDDWEEFTVTPVVAGKADKKARHHTDDEEDARGTAQCMARDYVVKA